MPQGSKAKNTDKQKRQAAHIEEGFRDAGLSEKEAGARAWTTINSRDGAGGKGGSGRKKPASKNRKPDSRIL